MFAEKSRITKTRNSYENLKIKGSNRITTVNISDVVQSFFNIENVLFNLLLVGKYVRN